MDTGDGSQHLEAVLTGHLDVEQEQVGLLATLAGGSRAPQRFCDERQQFADERREVMIHPDGSAGAAVMPS